VKVEAVLLLTGKRQPVPARNEKELWGVTEPPATGSRPGTGSKGLRFPSASFTSREFVIAKAFITFFYGGYLKVLIR
jgi:hypothetical protein